MVPAKRQRGFFDGFNGASDGKASAAADTLGNAASTVHSGADSNDMHTRSERANNMTAGIACSKVGSCAVHLPTLAESPRKAPDIAVPNPMLDDLKRRWEIFRRRDEVPANRSGNFRFRQRAEKQFPAVAQCKDSALPKLS